MKIRRYLCGIGEIAKKKKDSKNEGQMNRQVEIIWELKTEKLLTDQISKIIQSYEFSSLCSGSCSWFYNKLSRGSLQLLTKKWFLIYHSVFLLGFKYSIVYIDKKCQAAINFINIGI